MTVWLGSAQYEELTVLKVPASGRTRTTVLRAAAHLFAVIQGFGCNCFNWWLSPGLYAYFYIEIFLFYSSFRYLRRKGIIINETSAVVYAQLLTGRKYQISQNGEVRLEKQWSKQILPFVYQTIVKVKLAKSRFSLNVTHCIKSPAERSVYTPVIHLWK